MTREEISERAALLTMAVTLRLTGSGSDMIEAATDEMVKFYRATLQDAARAVCSDCRNDVDLGVFNDCGKTHWSHASEKGDTARCEAGPIHDLIAALDKEGS